MPSALTGTYTASASQQINYAAITTTVSDITWCVWQQQATATASACVTPDAWIYWCRSADTDGTGSFAPMYPQAPLETAEERRVREAQEAESARARLAAAAERIRGLKDAADRAAALLQDNLSDVQQAEFAKHRRFTVISKDGKRQYRINEGRSRNVERLDAYGKVMHRLCAHPAVDVPDFDTMLAQKLMLEHDEEAFLRVANVS